MFTWKDNRLALLALIAVAFISIISLRQNSTARDKCDEIGKMVSDFLKLQHSPPHSEESKKGTIHFVSPSCNCNKVIVVANDEAFDQNDRFRWCSMESDLRGYHQRIVTYVLFGDANNKGTFTRYYSLMRNISLSVEKLYPGWVVRFYHSFTAEDVEASKALCDVYCQFQHVDLCSVKKMWQRIDNATSPIDAALLRGLNRRMYRFLVMLDPRVDVFISRDIDSYIYDREVDAVKQWLPSNYTFHLMRDHPYHTDLVLAGMWGAKLFQQRGLIGNLTRKLVSAGQGQSKSQDQSTLANILWPVAKFDVMAHDSYQCENSKVVNSSAVKCFPFPTKRNGPSFVGGVGNAKIPKPCPVACRPPDHQDWEYC